MIPTSFRWHREIANAIKCRKVLEKLVPKKYKGKRRERAIDILRDILRWSKKEDR